MRHRAKRWERHTDAERAVPGTQTRPRRRAVVAMTAALALVVSPFLFAQSAQAASYTFLIDSTDVTATAKDSSPGDGVCRTAANTCTLRAALEESNALNLPAGSIRIAPAPDFNGNIDPVASGFQVMQGGRVSNQDANAHFEVTAPVTIDLENRVTVEATRDAGGGLFHVNGPDINFLNASQMLSGESSYIMGPNANRVTIDGGASITQAHYGPERFVVLREGAKNITVKNYQLQGFYNSGTDTGLFYVNAQNNTPIENVVIDNVRVTYTSGGTCGGSDGSGCRTTLLQFLPRNQNVVMDGFTFTNSFVSNLTNQTSFPFTTGTALSTSVRASNVQFTNNEFINVQGNGSNWTGAFIALPLGPMAGTNEISGNTFVRANSGQNFAIGWNGMTNSGSAGDLRIANNYFNGYSGTSIYLQNTGDVAVERNTFGARSASQARPGIAEETRDGTTSLFDNNTNANGRITTWYPAKDAAVLTAEAPAGAVQLESPLPAEVPACVATLDVTAPIDGPLPAEKVDLDLYWTQDRTAEVYLGRVSELTGKSAKLLLDLPVGPQEFPSTVVGETESATIVDADTGLGNGYIRLQTIGSDTRQSSQYSRMVGFSGSCRPELTLEQAAGQNDPTLARDLTYTLASSLPLDPESVSAAVVDVTAGAVTETIDAGRLNPRPVAVTPVAGTANREFTVTARVDDSALVTAGIAAERVRSLGGLTNRAAAASADPEITFTNPVQAKPSSFTLVTGEPDGKRYGFSVAAGAPKPAADLNFTAAPDQSAIDYQVELSSPTAVIPAGQLSSEQLRVTAAEGDVPANTPVTFTHSLSSDDTNYDGLVVNNLLVKLFSTDPSIKITKRAFTDVGDTSSPAQIMATGTEALSGTRLTDGQAVCFVYEVSNISADDWATVLTDVTVTDTDAQLGESGVIGTIETLPIGQSAQLSACGSLKPEDTTVGGTR
ncbi:right-handed parallel beta-helix repeat-containing protein [Leucobacter chromiireducens]|uniref:Right-handed parallel beta-helix repeat-containing protein n=1 Tax=Leucobacter chromiireducens subsp. solipictus TaxID=398235 RepID=A0ABS1SIB9_9MICO|nr:right-handed parallel beta-helix repeat-containing protein [Leucobacter chromiireducens]MBL3680306.1 right-handed parallel beta-helix repeat-containing protein [Leucobacter chromiireducens subsp. solipictus]